MRMYMRQTLTCARARTHVWPRGMSYVTSAIYELGTVRYCAALRRAYTLSVCPGLQMLPLQRAEKVEAAPVPLSLS